MCAGRSFSRKICSKVATSLELHTFGDCSSSFDWREARPSKTKMICAMCECACWVDGRVMDFLFENRDLTTSNPLLAQGGVSVNPSVDASVSSIVIRS